MKISVPSPISFLLFAALLSFCTACSRITLESDELGNMDFELAPVDLRKGPHSGRPVYISETQEGSLYLYHITADSAIPGVGRWVVNSELGSTTSALTFADSWAVAPHLIRVVNDVDKSNWVINVDGEWVVDESLSLFCTDEVDRTLYFDSRYLHRDLSGFYAAAAAPMDGSYEGPLFTKVQEFEDIEPLYLFRFEDRWLIGAQYGEDRCRAVLHEPTDFIEELSTQVWNFANDESEGFTEEVASVIHASEEFGDVYQALHRSRSIQTIPRNQTYKSLRNDVPIPTMGLGTGGLMPGDETSFTIEAALRMGYRMLDLAREYANEKTVALFFNNTRSDENYPLRDEVFLITKVWPTELGFIPTADAIFNSMQDLDSNYIDMYLLHWPICDASISWMHCETTVDPEGTWQESWHALEKAYAEGRVNSIGVSNFNFELLDEMSEIATVRPHLVQNHAEPGAVDMAVRSWCDAHNVLYQPYASLRNLASSKVLEPMKKLAAQHSVSEHVIALKFMIETNAVVIPRAKNVAHLQENLDVFDKAFELTPSDMQSLGWVPTTPPSPSFEPF